MIGNLIRVSKEELESFKLDSGKLEKVAYSANYDGYLDLDKSWEALHYILSGKSLAETEMSEEPKRPLDIVIFSDSVIDEEQDLGYGPAFYNDPDTVKAIAAELAKLDVDQLKTSYNGKKLDDQNIYPGVWAEPESKEYLFENLDEVIKFYLTASEKGQAIVGFVN